LDEKLRAAARRNCNLPAIAAYIFIDTENHSLSYAGAGHPPLILRDCSSGDTRQIVENGFFLGFFPDVTYTAVQVRFKEGDWGAFYTDGILEMTNPSEEQFGADRFQHFLENHHNLSAAQFVDGLLEELSRWSDRVSGREPEDDLTLLAVHFIGRERCTAK
jgi:serine phosphatase RsbU (regulator of sigma subunit)